LYRNTLQTLTDRPDMVAGGLWPECPACCRPLRGQLVASRCNHVFHRECLPAAECPQCGGLHVGRDTSDNFVADSDHDCPLELFGISFGEGAAGGLASLSLPRDASSRRAVNEICAMRDNLDEIQQREAQVQQGVLREKEKLAASQKKLAASQKTAQTWKKVCSQNAADLERCRKKYKDMCDEVQRNRERNTVVEYRRILLDSSGSPSEALTYLTKMVSMSLDPAPTLTEVARLRDYYRTSKDKWNREGVTATQRARTLEREIRQRQQTVADAKRKLQRRDSQLSQASQLSRTQSGSQSASQPSMTSECGSLKTEPHQPLKRQRTHE